MCVRENGRASDETNGWLTHTFMAAVDGTGMRVVDSNKKEEVLVRTVEIEDVEYLSAGGAEVRKGRERGEHKRQEGGTCPGGLVRDIPRESS